MCFKLSDKNKFAFKLFGLVFTVFVALFILAISSFADEDMVTFSVDGDKLIISGSGAISDFTSDVPAPWGEYKDIVKQVVIENGITRIGDMSFYSFANLESISVPEGLISVGDSAFYNCSSLVAINFASGVTEIGEYAFENCTSLMNVSNINAKTISEGAFSGCSSLFEISLDGAVTIDKYAFENCTSIQSITFTIDLCNINRRAFDGSVIAELLYEGTIEDFSTVVIEDGNSAVHNASVKWHCFGHDTPVIIEKVEATCTEEGYVLYGCVCGDVDTFDKVDVVSPLGHSYIKYTAISEEDGHRALISYCTVCFDTVYEVLEEPDDNEVYTVTWVVNNLTFTEKYKVGEIPALNFEMMEYTGRDGIKYAFSGFSPEIIPVNSDVTYTAEFTPVDGLYTIGDKTYCYVNGEKAVGWQTIEDKTYYFYVATGEMVKSETAVIGGLVREFNTDHSVKPLSGWQNVKNKIYYYVDGEMQVGWQNIDGKTYYFFRSDDKFGSMAWGWQCISNKLYYFYSFKGVMGQSGHLYDTSGYIGGVYYDIGEEGNVIVEGALYDGVGIRYLNENHMVVKNAFVRNDITGGKKYYFGSDGYALRNCTVVIGGKEYTFDENGICIG